jgi:hypothetical protein
MASGGGNVSEGSSLKSAQLLDLVKTHLTTDAGKELQKKVGFVYQINIAPKVTPPFSYCNCVEDGHCFSPHHRFHGLFV